MSRRGKSPSDSSHAWILLLFGLPFAAVGLGMAGWIIRDLVLSNEMKDWVETPATILSSKLETSRGSEGGTTYKVTATYTWEYDGETYQGNRVSLDAGSDNIGKFHQKTHRTLKQHANTEAPFPCYVNPEQPDEAILIRNLRGSMIGFRLAFALSFGPVGLGIMFAGVRGTRKEKRRVQTALDHPGEPWRANDEWASGRIQSEKGKVVLTFFFITLIWNALCSPVTFLIPGEVRDGAPVFLYIFFLFPLIGLGMAITWIYKLGQWIKYGESRLEMNSVPGVIGGKLQGSVITNRHLETDTGFVVTLKCERASRGKNDSVATLHEDSYTLSTETLAHDTTRSAIPILFAIPWTAKPSGDRITWKIIVKAETSGIDFSDYFEVPVFKTAHSDQDFRLNTASLQPYLKRDEEFSGS